jgi:acyl carrier protein
MDWTIASLTQLILETVQNDLLQVEPDFGPGSNLIEAGLDSLAVTQLMLAIEEKTGLWVDESQLTPENLLSCASLASCVHSEINGP